MCCCIGCSGLTKRSEDLLYFEDKGICVHPLMVDFHEHDAKAILPKHFKPSYLHLVLTAQDKCTSVISIDRKLYLPVEHEMFVPQNSQAISQSPPLPEMPIEIGKALRVNPNLHVVTPLVLGMHLVLLVSLNQLPALQYYLLFNFLLFALGYVLAPQFLRKIHELILE